MWNYEKRLEYPVNIKEPNPKIAQYIISQYGGPYCSDLSSATIFPCNPFSIYCMAILA